MRKGVLLIDDDPAVLSLYSNYLSKAGYSVAIADSSKMALSSANVLHFKLIITDLNLPDMNGIELGRLLKVKFPGIPVIAMTALSFAGQRDALVHAGFNGFLKKPVQREVFLNTVNKFMRR